MLNFRLVLFSVQHVLNLVVSAQMNISIISLNKTFQKKLIYVGQDN